MCRIALILAALAVMSVAKADPTQSGMNDALCVMTAIQSAVEKNITLSAPAQHIQVITTDDHEVYLLGNIANEDERRRIEDVARSFAVNYQIKDQLVVAK